MKKVWLSCITILVSAVLLPDPLPAENPTIDGDFELFSSEDNIYTVMVPRGVSEKSVLSGRVLWNYLAPGSTSPLVIRIHHDFIGLSISQDEYMNILEESKKSDGMETQKVAMENGRAFAYESKAKKGEDDARAVYLVALSERGWLCTLTFSGRNTIITRERPLIARIINSFHFPASRRK